MQRQILGLKENDGIHTDHKNGNGLDNQKHNLRTCSQAQNNRNAKKRENCSSKYKGVYWDKKNKKWRARIYLNKKEICLGRYKNEIDAAKAYDEKAKELFGEFAQPNGCTGRSFIKERML